MTDEKRIIDEYLEKIVSKYISAPSAIKIPKKELMRELNVFEKIKDPIEQWEKIEPYLIKKNIIDNWVIKFNMFTENLVFQHIPTIHDIKYAEENRETSLDATLRKEILNINHRQFEKFVSEFFKTIPGFQNMRTTKQNKDGGFDITGKYKDRELRETRDVYGEVKHWNLPTKVGDPHIDRLLGVLTRKSKGNPVIGIFVCTSGFVKKNAVPSIQYYDLDDIIAKMKEHHIGLTTHKSEITVLNDTFWNEIKDET